MENINALTEDPLKTPEDVPLTIEPIETKEKEFDTRSFLDKLYADAAESVAVAKAVAVEETPTDRQIAYGIAQETTLIGNALRYGQALVDSYTYDASFADALKVGEYERQTGIAKEFPEYKYLTEEEESMTMLGGRLGVALVDPATILVPWIKIAKAGKVSSVAINASIAAVDSATRDKLIHGEVNLVNLGASTVLGGLGGLASAAIYGKKGADSLAEIAEDTEAIARVPVVSDEITPTILTESEVVTIAESAQNLFTHSDIIKLIPEVSATGTNLTLRAEPINQMKAILTDMRALLKAADRKKIISSLQKEEYKKLEILTDPTSKLAKSSEEKLLTEADTLAARLKILREAPKRPTPSYKNDIKIQIKALEDKIEEATTKLYSNHIDKATASADMAVDIAEDLAAKGKLTDNILAGLISEATRPLIGGVGGFATGATLGDDDDDAMLATLVGLGVGAGVLSKRLNKLKITGFDLENVKMTVAETGRNSLLATTKILSAGTTATKLDAYGGWAKIIGNLLLQKPGAATNAVETTYASDVSKYMNKVVNVFGDSYNNKSVKEVVTAVTRGWVSADSLTVGYKGINNGLKKGLTAEDIDEVRRIAPAITAEQNILKQSMRDAGINFSDIDNYGMAQLWNFKNIMKGGIDKFQEDAIQAFTIQDQNRVAAGVLETMTSPKALEEKAIDFVNKIRGIKTKADEDSIVHRGVFNKDGSFIPLTDHFERKRVITDVEATSFMAQKGWLTLDPIEISAKYADKSIKVRNFANVFGAKGELITRAFSDIEKTLGGKGKTGAEIAFKKKYEDQLKSSLNAFWGVHGSADKYGKLGSVIGATFTTLANVTYLPRVVVSSLGDLIQPIQNSGVFSAIKSSKSIVPGVKSFASRAGFQYDKSWERELQAVQTQGADPLSTIHNNLATINKRFFQAVLLSTLTKAARTFAYDAGIYRTFDIAKKIEKSKGRISKSLQTEMNGLGIDKDQLSVISKFKNAEEAFSDENANVFLDMAGRRSADRDAIVPIVGNRLLFTQSNDPFVKATGQFLSWAQAKSAQSNYLIERLEDGDAKQAVRMLTGAVVYAGVGWLKEWSKPNYDEYNPDNLEPVSVKGIQRGLAISGNFLPWQVDKIVNTLSTPDYRPVTSNIAPALNIIDDLWRATKRVSEDPTRLKNLPVINELTSYYERMNRAAGGVVNVPQAPKEPDQRIDKMTGLPYDVQAGDAFIDNEDPLRRLGFKGGGVVIDPLKRMGFGIGGAVVKLGKTALKSLDDDVIAPVLTGPLKTTDELIEEGKKLSNDVLNNLDEALLANSASRTTQRANTVGTATKASSYLDSLGATGRSLDYGAGKGLNAQTNKIDDTFEPFPDESFIPTFKNPTEVPENTYGKIISTNVINVLPPDLRKEAIMNIGKALKVGGKALIQTWDAGAAKKGMASKKAKVVTEEPLAYTTSTGSYQKGFTIGELKKYVEDTLGKSFEVSTVPNKQGISGVSVVISKNTDDVEMSSSSSAIFGFGKKPKAPMVEKTAEEVVVEPVAPSFEKVADDLVLNTEGKSLADVTRYVGFKGLEAGKEDYKIIADKVANQLNALEKEGFSFDYQIARLKSGSSTALEKPAPTALVRGGSAGVANFSGVDKKVSVFINDITPRDSLANGMNPQTILHESVHAATMASIRVGNLASQKGTKLHKDVQDLYSLFNYVIGDFNKKAKDPTSLSEYETKLFRRMNNSMANVDEIVAWGLTNPDMQKYLETIKYGDTNAWTAFVQRIRTMLGMSAQEDTALSELLRVSDELLNADVKQVASVVESTTSKRVKNNEGGLVLKSLKRKTNNV